MADFTVRSDSVSVEQIMDQIRTRITEKRGIDYTEDEVRRLATVKLETFLDPTKARSDLVERYRRRRQAGPPTADSSQSVDDERRSPPSYDLEDTEIYGSSRGIVGRVIKLVRRLLNPILKLFFNPDPIVRVLHVQNQINAHTARQLERGRREVDELCFELLDDLLVEMTRLSIDMKNYKMRLESVSSRLDFDERRARALNGRGLDTVSAPRPVAVATPAGSTEEGGKDTLAAAGTGRRRRRRRRGQRRPPGGTSVSPSDSSAPGPPDNSGSVEPETTPPAPDAGGSTGTSEP